MRRDSRKTHIVPAEFPQLAMLLWNRDITRPMPRAEALEVYERNWRHVDAGTLSEAEAALLRELADEFGHGHLLVSL